MKKIQLVLIVLLVGIQAAFAQSVQVSGKVTYSDDGAPVIGATINVKGTQIATLSDVNGVYTLTIPAKETKVLVVTYTGLLSQEIPTPTSGVYNVSMQTDALQAEDVVVTGYGSVSRKNYAGSAAVVSTEKLKDVPSISVADRLAGNVAGLTVTSTSGQPGAVQSIRIRGMGSITAGNEPLYVIDGVPIMSGNAASFTYSEAGNSLLSTINPADIESLTVIKDAAAASLYGSRAANGVVVITTKKGASGKTRFNVKADLGFSNMAVNWRPVLNGVDRRAMQHLGWYNYATNVGGYNDARATAYADANINVYASPSVAGQYTDPNGANYVDPSNPNNYQNWKDLLFRQGLNQNYEVSAQGGTDKTKFYASLGYVNQKGITYKQQYDRLSGRINLEHKAGIFTLNVGSTFASTNQQSESEGASFTNPFMAYAMTVTPSDRAYNEDGTVNTTSGFAAFGGGGALSNPIWTRQLNYDKTRVTRSFNNITGQLDLFKGFAVKEVLAYDYINTDSRVWWDPRSNDGRGSKGVYQRYANVDSRLTSQTMAMYNRLFADVHNLSVLASFEVEQSNSSSIYANGSNYASPLKPEINNAAQTRAGSSFNSSTLMSFVAKADYTFDNRIYVGASFRRDGSSRLSPDKRWGDFWSASAFWRISNERWYRDGGISTVLTDARIRASYGENGTQPPGANGWDSYWGFGFNYNGNPGMAQNTLIVPEGLTWEKSLAANIGFDLTFIDRISLGVDIYNRDTKDLIMNLPTSSTTGYTSVLRNVGSMNNKGIEVSLSAIAIQTKDVNWTIGFNVSHNRNTVKSLYNDLTQMTTGYQIRKIGQPYYSFYMYEYAGVDSETGKELYYSNKKLSDGTLSRETTTNSALADKVIVGTVEPVVSGGINTQFSYKWIDFGFTMTFSLGGNGYDEGWQWLGSNGGDYNYLGNIPTYYKIDQTWKKPGDKAALPKFQYGTSATMSSRFMFSTDHLRLKNITLGLSAPKQWTKKMSIEKLRIYASASNLFTIKSKDCYVDPEVPVHGISMFQSTPLRTVTFGLEIGF